MRATLRIDVIYDREGGRVPTPEEARETLNYAAERLAGEGLLSGANDVCLDSWSARVTTSDDEQKALEMQLWNAIEAYAEACGATNLRSKESVEHMCAVEDVIAEFRYALETLERRVESKEETLRDIGKASFLIKNTAQGDVLLLPGNLELKVSEGLKK